MNKIKCRIYSSESHLFLLISICFTNIIKLYFSLNILYFSLNVVTVDECLQLRQKIDNWGGGDIHIFAFTGLESNGFQKKLKRQNMNQ